MHSSNLIMKETMTPSHLENSVMGVADRGPTARPLKPAHVWLALSINSIRIWDESELSSL
jgi:hypothetical protein